MFVTQTVDEKSTLSLVCRVTGHPEPEVKWFRDDKQVAASLKSKMTKDGDLYTFVTTNMTTKLGGTYKVVAANRAGVAEHVADVTVKGTNNLISEFLARVVQTHYFLVL